MPLMQVVDNASAASNGGEFAGMQASLLSTEQLRQLFSLLPDTPSDTYELLCGQADEEGEWCRGRKGRSTGAGQGVTMHGRCWVCLGRTAPLLWHKHRHLQLHVATLNVYL